MLLSFSFLIGGTELYHPRPPPPPPPPPEKPPPDEPPKLLPEDEPGAREAAPRLDEKPLEKSLSPRAMPSLLQRACAVPELQAEPSLHEGCQAAAARTFSKRFAHVVAQSMARA